MNVQEWRRRYIAQLLARGMDQDSADACCEALDDQQVTELLNHGESPEDAANDEIGYMSDAP